ncbi:MAG TPA: 30S ribosomal protein S6 [Candidatus Paceibacterota bacterium]|nr:30S ribosomal protein S6 [Candidatus Paceibacterota bacterium]
MAETSQVSAETSSQANAPKDTRLIYEIGFHVVPTVEEAKVGDVVETIRTALSSIKADIIGEQFPNKITLAYEVERSTTGKREKYTQAYFGWIKFAVEERDGISSVEAMLRSSKDILRYLLVASSLVEAIQPRRAVFSSNRLEGETIKKPTAAPEEAGVVSEAELDKSIEALVSDEKAV